MESSVESAMELAMESAMATTGELRLTQPPPEVGWLVEHWDQVSGVEVCHVLGAVPLGLVIHLLQLGPLSICLSKTVSCLLPIWRVKNLSFLSMTA